MLSRLVGVEMTRIRQGSREAKLILLEFRERHSRNEKFKQRLNIRLLLDCVEIVAGQQQLTAQQFSDELGFDVTPSSLRNFVVLACKADSAGHLTIKFDMQEFVMRATSGSRDAPTTNWILHMNNARIARGDERFVRFRGKL